MNEGRNEAPAEQERSERARGHEDEWERGTRARHPPQQHPDHDRAEPQRDSSAQDGSRATPRAEHDPAEYKPREKWPGGLQQTEHRCVALMAATAQARENEHESRIAQEGQ